MAEIERVKQIIKIMDKHGTDSLIMPDGYWKRDDTGVYVI